MRSVLSSLSYSSSIPYSTRTLFQGWEGIISHEKQILFLLLFQWFISSLFPIMMTCFVVFKNMTMTQRQDIVMITLTHSTFLLWIYTLGLSILFSTLGWCYFWKMLPLLSETNSFFPPSSSSSSSIAHETYGSCEPPRLSSRNFRPSPSPSWISPSCQPPDITISI